MRGLRILLLLSGYFFVCPIDPAAADVRLLKSGTKIITEDDETLVLQKTHFLIDRDTAQRAVVASKSVTAATAELAKCEREKAVEPRSAWTWVAAIAGAVAAFAIGVAAGG